MTFEDAQQVLEMDGNTDSFYRYEPRPDDHQRFDQQTFLLDDNDSQWSAVGNVLAIPTSKAENQATVAVSERVGSNVDPLFATA